MLYWCDVSILLVWSYALLQIMNIFIDILSEDTVKNLTAQAPPMAKADMDLSPMGKYQPMTPLGTFDNPFLSRALYLTRSAGTPSQSLLGGTPLRSPARGTAEYRQAALTAVRARCALLLHPFVSKTMSCLIGGYST